MRTREERDFDTKLRIATYVIVIIAIIVVLLRGN